MPEFLQHIIVSIVALGAAAIVVRRVAGIVRPPRSSAATPCANCPSAAQHRVESPSAAPDVKPLTLVRR